MRVGDLVRSGRGDIGMVLGIGYTGRESAWDRRHYGPTVSVITQDGKMLLAFTALELVNESR